MSEKLGLLVREPFRYKNRGAAVVAGHIHKYENVLFGLYMLRFKQSVGFIFRSGFPGVNNSLLENC